MLHVVNTLDERRDSKEAEGVELLATRQASLKEACQNSMFIPTLLYCYLV
jgi:hypothetical protein